MLRNREEQNEDLQRRLERDPMLVTRRLQEEMRLAEQIAQREAEGNRTLMALPRPQQVVRINALRNRAGAQVAEQDLMLVERYGTGFVGARQRLARIEWQTEVLRNRLAEVQDPNWIEFRRGIIAQARQQIIAVQREFQARQRTAIQMMEEVERLRENAGSLGCSVM
ncbi:MAG: hypothetical protein LBB37_01100 [Endomicrobium sp.]|nr:hypothetical protein [Endomicrobium sp.]